MPGSPISQVPPLPRACESVLRLTEPLNAMTAGLAWPRVMRAATAARGRPWVLDVSGLACDTAGAALLAAAIARHGQATLRGAPAELAALVLRIGTLPQPRPPGSVGWTFAGLAHGALAAAGDSAAFLGGSLVAVVMWPRHRRQIRLTDIVRLMDAAGAQAVPLLLLVGYLIGLILAFQSAIPLRRFGAELFVVNAVALSLLRELGPLLAGVLLSGRTGSAFAAELGTMKVNEELAALETMGLSPMTMLVLPRLVAAVIVTPVMALMLEVAGLAGMLSVLLAFGFPLPAISAQLLRAVHLPDVWTGLFKAMCFGAITAGIGCRAGLAAGDGPRAVGVAATRAVVGGIVASIVLDGVFSIFFYRLGV